MLTLSLEEDRSDVREDPSVVLDRPDAKPFDGIESAPRGLLAQEGTKPHHANLIPSAYFFEVAVSVELEAEVRLARCSAGGGGHSVPLDRRRARPQPLRGGSHRPALKAFRSFLVAGPGNSSCEEGGTKI